MATAPLDPTQLSSRALDDLYASSPAGPIPTGRGTGTAVVAPGTRAALPLARIGAAFWRGKVFDPIRHELVNMVTPFEYRGIRAQVREEASLLDGAPCIAIDYSSTSRLAKWIRDEIRQVGPEDYLGVVFVKQRRIPLRFWLHFPTSP